MSVPLAYLGVIAIWSTTPLAIQWSAAGAGFSFAVLARMLIGVCVALTLIALARVPFPFHRQARRSYLVGGLGIFGAMLSTYWGAQYIHSGLISVLFGLSPLVTSLMAAIWLGEKALAPAKLLGIALALTGLALIFVAGHDSSGHQTVLGIVALLVAVVVYSGSLVGMKRIGDRSPPLATTAGSLLVCTPLFLIAWWLADGRLPEAMPPKSAGAIAYLGVFGSVLGFALYYYVIKHMEAGKVALITLVTPVLALLLGHLLNREAVEPRVWLGAGLISLGLIMHHWPLVTRRRLARLAAIEPAE
jgi:drug/metabolite transporter (DMT)-like permease